MKNNFDIIVIGSGLGGLTAGAELSRQGKRVLVLEQHFRVGGSATSFRRKDFIYEAGLHMTTTIEEGHHLYNLFHQCEIIKKIHFLKVPEFYHVLLKDHEFTFENDVQDTLTRLIKMFPSEERGIRTYFDSIFKICDQTMAVNEKKGFMRFFALLSSPFKYPKVVNALFTSIGKYLDRIIADERLKLILLGNMGYYGDDPYGISLIFYAIAQAGYYRHGGAYIQGGSHHLPDALAACIEKNNGMIMTMQEVTRILTENGKAIGVEYQSKRKDATVSRTYADTIIANTAIPNIHDSLMDAKDARKIKRKYGAYHIGPSIMTVYIALNKPLADLGNSYYSLVFYNQDNMKMKDLPKLNHADFSQRPFILCDYSQIDARLAPEGKGYLVLSLMDYLEDWETLSESDYKFKKKQIADTLVKRVCERFPDMCDHIERVEVATARTMKHYLMTPGGTAYGYANTPSQALIFRPGARSSIKNLYYASAWTLPGAGFGGALTSGDICAEQIKKDLGII